MFLVVIRVEMGWNAVSQDNQIYYLFIKSINLKGDYFCKFFFIELKNY